MQSSQGLTLPEGYSSLEPFVGGWALSTNAARVAKREGSSMADIEAFYEVMLPQIENVLANLDQHPLGAMPKSYEPLYYLVLAFAEAALAVESYRAPKLPLPPGTPASTVVWENIDG